MMNDQLNPLTLSSYFDSCHPWAPVLSEDIRKTPTKLRNTSPLLFLAIVCVGTRFWSTKASQYVPRRVQCTLDIVTN